MNKSLLSCSVLAAIFTSSAFAVEPADIRLDNGVVITPKVETGLKNDDNIFSTADNKKSSSIFTVAPSANFLLENERSKYEVNASIESGSFLQSSDDNYLDGSLDASAKLMFSEVSNLSFGAGAIWAHEARGTGLTEGQGDAASEPVTYTTEIVDGEYEYGNKASFGRLVVGAQYFNKDYTNFAEATQGRSYDSVKFDATGYYNTRSGTDVLLQASFEDFSYDGLDASGISRDSEDNRLLVGLDWDVTGVTAGHAKVGYQDKNFNDSQREDFSGVSWDAGITWQPLSYTSLNLVTTSAAVDPTVDGDYIDRTSYTVTWNHTWNEKISSALQGSWVSDDYTASAGDAAEGRQDDLTMLRANVDYKFARWVDASLFIEYTDSDSTLDTIVYDKSIVGVNFTFTL